VKIKKFVKICLIMGQISHLARTTVEVSDTEGDIKEEV
jgi:hypothetical protein